MVSISIALLILFAAIPCDIVDVGMKSFRDSIYSAFRNMPAFNYRYKVQQLF